MHKPPMAKINFHPWLRMTKTRTPGREFRKTVRSHLSNDMCGLNTTLITCQRLKSNQWDCIFQYGKTKLPASRERLQYWDTMFHSYRWVYSITLLAERPDWHLIPGCRILAFRPGEFTQCYYLPLGDYGLDNPTPGSQPVPQYHEADIQKQADATVRDCLREIHAARNCWYYCPPLGYMDWETWVQSEQAEDEYRAFRRRAKC